ncbi:hypothetical protein M440DRAFT_1398230 [Trichoderma longibrachiatum ATCC 18648]|uniref:Uncharacterized protein n=1 Tax=Trichoderma longibrachiatum ATCC 18648 TaxID=983965 RepID=A0A2T4CBR6_TRILO|nr:hypothetical protein M440DRAFT_1398230 [Trichoderma longibrachiatum ATCC 18648]
MCVLTLSIQTLIAGHRSPASTAIQGITASPGTPIGDPILVSSLSPSTSQSPPRKQPKSQTDVHASHRIASVQWSRRYLRQTSPQPRPQTTDCRDLTGRMRS